MIEKLELSESLEIDIIEVCVANCILNDHLFLLNEFELMVFEEIIENPSMIKESKLIKKIE